MVIIKAYLLLYICGMKKILYIICTVLIAVSCTKEDRKNQLVTQEEAIDRYISSLKDVRIARNGGSNRIVLLEGNSADSLALGDSLKFYYAGYIFNNGKGALFATNNADVAENKGFQLSGGVEEKVLSDSELVKGLTLGLVGAKAGEHCEIVFSAKYGYDNTAVYNVPKMTPLIFEVWIESIGKN